MMPPALEHGWLSVDRRHRVDSLLRVIHSLNSQRALVFMNFQHRLKVRAATVAAAASGQPVWSLRALAAQNQMRQYEGESALPAQHLPPSRNFKKARLSAKRATLLG